MENGMVGYNLDEVKAVLNGLISSYEQLIGEIGYRWQRTVIEKISQTWFAPEAQTACVSLVDNQSEVLHKSAITYSDIVSNINEAARNWATASGEVYTPINGDWTIPELDASIVKADNNGFKGIIDTNIDEIFNDLAQIEAESHDALNKAEDVIMSHQAFIGASQSEQLATSIEVLRDTIITTIDNNMTMVRKELEDTRTKYQQTAQANATRFSAGN